MTSEMGTEKTADDLSCLQVIGMFTFLIGECLWVGGLIWWIFDPHETMAVISAVGAAMIVVVGYLFMREPAPPVAEREP